MSQKDYYNYQSSAQEQEDNVRMGLMGDAGEPSYIRQQSQPFDNDSLEILNNMAEYQPPHFSYAQNEMNMKLGNFMARLKEKLQTDQQLAHRQSEIDAEESVLSDCEQELEAMDAKQKQKYLLGGQKAPRDATRHGKPLQEIQSLKKYAQDVSSQNKDPKSAYFDQSKEYFSQQLNDKDCKKTVTVKSYLITEDQKNYVKNLSVEILNTDQGCVPIIKTLESQAYKAGRFIKALKFYNQKGDFKLQKQIIVDEGILDQNYKTYDTSVLGFQNTVLFYKREENYHKLQQYDFVKNELEQLDGYQIEEPKGFEIRFHIMFSQEFGKSNQQIDAEKNKKITVHEFLSKQYVVCQSFRVKNDSSFQVMPIVLMSMKDMTEILMPSHGKTRILKETIQYVAHIQDDNSRMVTFLAITPFSTHSFDLNLETNKHSDFIDYHGNDETQIQLIEELLNEGKPVAWKHENLNPFYMHENSQFIIQNEQVTNERGQTITQYFHLTNANQFQLVHPNYQKIDDKIRVISQIAYKMSSAQPSDEDEFSYEENFIQRQKQFSKSICTKISHISNRSYKSKTYFKESQHLKKALDYHIDLNIRDKVVLSTDQERSSIYIYQSDQITPESKIQVINFENQRAYSSKMGSLPLQIKELIAGEEETYGPRQSTKKIQCANNSYYINCKYEKVISSKTHIKTRFEDLQQQTLPISYSIEKSEKDNFIIVEQNNGVYMHLKVKQDYNPEKIELQMYCKGKSYYTFLFTLLNDEDKFDKKLSYFLIRKTFKEIEGLSNDSNQSLIMMDQEVVMIQENDLKDSSEKQLLQNYTQKIDFKDFVDLQRDSPNQNISLTFELLYDTNQDFEFIPMIYQEKKIIESHCLLIFDTEKLEFVSRTNINSNIKIRKFLRRNETGFAMYTLTRTSNVFMQPQNFFNSHSHPNQPVSQIVKYQISSQFYILKQDLQQLNQAVDETQKDPAKCTIELNEYLVKFSCCEKNEINLIGRKQLILSDALSAGRKASFKNMQFLPYFDTRGRIKGSTFVLQEDSGSVIDLLDQEHNNLYSNETEMLQFGYQKYFTSPNNQEEYLLVVSCQFKQKIYLNGNFENNEAKYILSKIQKKLLSMRLAKFEYFLLSDDFNQIMQTSFFQSQQILEGRSICDLCVNFHKEVSKRLDQSKDVYKRIEGSLIDELCGENESQYEHFLKVGIFEENLIIQSDFNFITTLRLAMELNENQTVKMLLEKIYEIDDKKYQELFMLDLPVFLKQYRIERIYKFLSQNRKNQNSSGDFHDNTLQNCIFEEFIDNPNLPLFSSEKEQYYVKETFKDFHNSYGEIIQEVIERDPQMTWAVYNFEKQEERYEIGKPKENEVEHSLIDFQKIIIGEKVRGYQESEYIENISFNDHHLAKLLYIEADHQIDFYKLESVNKLVNFQFVQTQQFLQLIFRLYALGFVIPFCLTLVTKNVYFLNLLFTICFISQVLFLLFELIQIKEQKVNYFDDFWNLIDMLQFVSFFILFIKKMCVQFTTDTTFEILLQAIILCQCLYKGLYFVRIYKGFCFVFVVFSECRKSLMPFFIINLTVMVGFAMVYQLLHSGINDPNGEMNYLHYNFLKRLVQTFKNSQGSYVAPILDGEMIVRLEGDEYNEDLVYLVMISVWIFQVLYFLVASAVFIAKVMEIYIKVYNNFPELNQKIRARFNYESYQTMHLFIKQRKFKMIFITKDTSQDEDETLMGTTVEFMRGYLEQIITFQQTSNK